MSTEYYFVSDLHIGGDGDLQECNFEDEFLTFLSELETKNKDTELIIVGDSFGLWEFTEIEGIDKLEELIRHHQRLFNQFKKTGEKIGITIIPGNHDYELACFPEFIERLKDFNIKLEPEISVIKEIGNHKIWIEHGMQQDEYNHMPDFGNPHANPLGYFVTRHLVATAGKQSSLGRYNWLKDIQSVSPMEAIPHWMLSNYFYREMHGVLRLLVLPFLVLFSISIVALIGALLEEYSILNSTVFTNNEIFSSLGFVGNIIDIIIMVNGTLILFAITLAIPILLFSRDVRQTLKRFSIFPEDGLVLEKESDHIDIARKVFKQNPDTKIYLYGHTHNPFIEKLHEGTVVNTGTWLKQFTRVASRFWLLPDVYYPHYCLNYFVIKEEDKKLVINYYIIEKDSPPELSLLQRFVIFGRWEKKNNKIPEKTIVDL